MNRNSFRKSRKRGLKVLGLLVTIMTLVTLTYSAYFKDNATSTYDIPSYSGEAYAIINDNIPYFTEQEIEEAYTSYEYYQELDDLGRATLAIASISIDTMPTEERESIGMIKPSGWQTVRYDDLIDGNYLYNRCHLIGYQLTGENANELNLITGTRYMNVEGMLPFEDAVATYVKETNNHVLYRVTPIYEGSNLVASGVLIEAISIEDGGELMFCVFVYNVQPCIEIDYSNGDSKAIDGCTVD